MEIILGIATILGGITAIWFFWDKYTQRKVYKQHFPQTDDDFYKYYAEQVSSAEYDIWLTSDGFNIENPKSRAYSKIMTTAFETALSKGVTLFRFQIIETMHVNWIEELVRLKEKYPNNFKIYANESIKSVPNVCAIDADHKKCIGERMEHVTGLFGQGSQARTYSFVHKDKNYAQSTKNIVEDLINHPTTKEYNLSSLRAWKKELIEKRTEHLVHWMSKNPNTTIKESGVFDEEVITNYIQLPKGEK